MHTTSNRDSVLEAEMQLTKTHTLGAGTLVCALGIGYLMQFGFGLPGGNPATAEHEFKVTGIMPTSAASAPEMPNEGTTVPELPQAKVVLANVDVIPLETPSLPRDQVDGGIECDVTLTAEPGAGAMVALKLAAPCQGSERVTFHHSGLMFTEVTQPDGTLSLDVPALSQDAMFIAAFDNGEGAVAQTNVSSLPFYDRVAVQWKGDGGLQLHAREFAADYFTEGHIWRAAAGDIKRTAQGKGGFLTVLGNDSSPEALRAEIYSYPAGTTQNSGDIAMTVEAEVTAENCTRDVEAQSLELHEGGALRVRDLTLSMPDCDAVGDFLVLKNLVEDLTIAAN
jgi:hypothetical protein